MSNQSVTFEPGDRVTKSSLFKEVFGEVLAKANEGRGTVVGPGQYKDHVCVHWDGASKPWDSKTRYLVNLSDPQDWEARRFHDYLPRAKRAHQKPDA